MKCNELLLNVCMTMTMTNKKKTMRKKTKSLGRTARRIEATLVIGDNGINEKKEEKNVNIE